MTIRKLLRGVLRVQTPAGYRHFRPTFWDRVALAWMFRNFTHLPLQVLSPAQCLVLSKTCSAHRAVAILGGWQTLLGTVEVQSLAELAATRKPVSSETRVKEREAASV